MAVEHAARRDPGTQVPGADAVFFTVVKGNQGEAVQVMAGSMSDPDAWALAVAELLGSVQRGQLRPLRAGRLILRQAPVALQQPYSQLRGEGTIHLRTALPDMDVRRLVLAAVRTGRAHLEVRGNETWYIDPQLGRDVRTRDLRCDPQLGLVIAVSAPDGST